MYNMCTYVYMYRHICTYAPWNVKYTIWLFTSYIFAWTDPARVVSIRCCPRLHCATYAMVTPWNQDEQEEHTADHQGLGRQRSSSFRCWARIFAENSAKNKACQWASHGNKSDSKTNMGNAKFGHPQRGLHDFQWCDGIVLHQHWVRYCEKARCIHIYWSIRI